MKKILLSLLTAIVLTGITITSSRSFWVQRSHQS